MDAAVALQNEIFNLQSTLEEAIVRRTPPFSGRQPLLSYQVWLYPD